MKTVCLAAILAVSLNACVITPVAVLGGLTAAVATINQACNELSDETKTSVRRLNDGKPIICGEAQ